MTERKSETYLASYTFRATRIQKEEGRSETRPRQVARVTAVVARVA